MMSIFNKRMNKQDVIDNTMYFGETSTEFSEYETGLH